MCFPVLGWAAKSWGTLFEWQPSCTPFQQLHHVHEPLFPVPFPLSVSCRWHTNTLWQSLRSSLVQPFPVRASHAWMTPTEKPPSPAMVKPDRACVIRVPVRRFNLVCFAPFPAPSQRKSRSVYWALPALRRSAWGEASGVMQTLCTHFWAEIIVYRTKWLNTFLKE